MYINFSVDYWWKLYPWLLKNAIERQFSEPSGYQESFSRKLGSEKLKLVDAQEHLLKNN